MLSTAGKTIGLALYKAATAKNEATSQEAWIAVGEEIAKQIVANAVVTGTAPSGGGKIPDGKIQ
jgi:hypothetical protein